MKTPTSRRAFLTDAAAGMGLIWETSQRLAEPSRKLPDTPAREQGADSAGGEQRPAMIQIDYSKVLHTMAGGAGACWHAIGPTGYWYKDLLPGKVNRNARGSAWGANPPLNYTDAWSDLLRHARWLGLNFIRVTIDMRMYEPEAGKFDWQNDQMRTLYRILDYCQENHVDVFFQQMWQDVEWNAFPGAGRLQSAPKSVPAFSHGLGTLMEHLVLNKGYTCIRWLCIANEPGSSWSWWQGPDGKPVSIMPALHAVRAELDRRGVEVGLSAPDWSPMGKVSADFDFDDKAVAAFDAHDYGYFPETALQKLWTDRARARGIPFFQSEFGTWAGESPFGNPMATSPRSYPNQLVNAEKVIGGLNVGVDGFCRWSFVNRGDLDGQWQLVRTFNTTNWQCFERVMPEPVPYFCYGILTRFMAKHSTVVQTAVGKLSLVVTALRSPHGNLTVYVLNKSSAAEPIELAPTNLGKPVELHKYEVTESSVEDPAFVMDPLATFTVSAEAPKIVDTLPPMSLTSYTSYGLKHSEPGVIAD